MTEYKIKLLQDIQAEKAEINEHIQASLHRIVLVSTKIRDNAQLAVTIKHCPDIAAEFLERETDQLSQLVRDLRDGVQQYDRLSDAEDKII